MWAFSLVHDKSQLARLLPCNIPDHHEGSLVQQQSFLVVESTVGYLYWSVVATGMNGSKDPHLMSKMSKIFSSHTLELKGKENRGWSSPIVCNMVEPASIQTYPNQNSHLEIRQYKTIQAHAHKSGRLAKHRQLTVPFETLRRPDLRKRCIQSRCQDHII